MKRKIFLFLIILFLVQVSFAFELTREMPVSIDSGNDLNVVLDIGSISDAEEIEISETIPEEFVFSDWEITGTDDSKEDILQINGNVYIWFFTANSDSASITYSVFVPATITGDYTLKSEWNGNTEETVISVKKTEILVTSIKDTTSIFDKKEKSKKKKNPAVLILAAIIVLGLTGFGIYKQRKKKKGGTSFKKTKVKEEKEEKKIISKTPEEHNIERMEYIEKASHELPSFTDETSLIELPSLEEKTKKLPPVFKPEERKSEEAADKLKQVDDLLDKIKKKKK